MKHEDFKIGQAFTTETGRWVCTDKGTRTVTALRASDMATETDPPYSTQEVSFDEGDFPGCEPAPWPLPEAPTDPKGEGLLVDPGSEMHRRALAALNYYGADLVSIRMFSRRSWTMGVTDVNRTFHILHVYSERPIGHEAAIDLVLERITQWVKKQN